MISLRVRCPCTRRRNVGTERFAGVSVNKLVRPSGVNLRRSSVGRASVEGSSVTFPPLRTKASSAHETPLLLAEVTSADLKKEATSFNGAILDFGL